jgi:hypothetical protein
MDGVRHQPQMETGGGLSVVWWAVPGTPVHATPSTPNLHRSLHTQKTLEPVHDPETTHTSGAQGEEHKRVRTWRLPPEF